LGRLDSSLLIGGLFLGAGVLLILRARDTANITTQPQVVVVPSTDADESTVANLSGTVKQIHHLFDLQQADGIG